ncbi:MAG: gamma-glutamyl-gamma-aminobutyrate hydrolase family protein [Defluviicoccus sp.]
MSDVLALRHVPFEDLAYFEAVLTERGLGVRYVDAVTDDLAAIDAMRPGLVVVLGGPIGAYEDTAYPFLGDELRLIERRLRANRPTLGICLGAQLMARALGARVYPGPVK